MANDKRQDRRGPAGERIRARGKDGPQIIATTGKRWSEAAEKTFLDHLAASCNITRSAAAAGFSATRMFQLRRADPAFAQRWQAALEQGHARLSALLVQRAIEALEGFAPDTETPIPEMTVGDALRILGHHQRTVDGGPRSRRQWARPRTLDELSETILAKLEAIAPEPVPLPPPPGPSDEA